MSAADILLGAATALYLAGLMGSTHAAIEQMQGELKFLLAKILFYVFVLPPLMLGWPLWAMYIAARKWWS